MRGTVQLHGIGGSAAARDCAFRIDEVIVDGGKARRRGDRLHVRILAIQAGDVLQGFLPGGFIELQRNGRLYGNKRRRPGEVVDGIRVDAESFEFGLLFGERLAGFLVGAVGGEPDLATERDGVVIERQDRGLAFAAPVEAVLLVVADANDDAQDTIVPVLIFAEGAKSGFGGIVFDVADAILDEIGRLDLIHLELRFGTVEFGEQGFEKTVAFNGDVSGSQRGVERGFRVTGGGAESMRHRREGKNQRKCQVAVKPCHGFTSALVSVAVFAGGALSSKPGGGNSGGRSC